MALVDPVVITIGGTPYSHARTLVSGRQSQYEVADGNRKFTVSHEVDSKNNKRGESHLVKLTQRKLTTNPLINLQEWVEGHVWTVIKQPSNGFTDTELKDMLVGLNAYLTATIIDKILGNEH
jgi:hypothetical protein